MTVRTIALLASLFVSGCGGVVSRRAASDEATTRADERLVGFWRVDFEASHAGEDAAHDEGIVVVAHRSATDAGLRVTTITLRRGAVLETITGDVAPTTIAGRSYASVAAGSAEKPDDSPLWSILRYDLPEPDTLRVLSMDEDRAAADVRSGAAAGTVSDLKEKDGTKRVSVTLDAPTAALRAYLESRGDGLYRADRPLVLRRIHPR